MWIAISVVLVLAVLILIALSRGRQRWGAAKNALDPNQWYDRVLDKQTSKRAANADEAEIKRLIKQFNSSYDEGGLAAQTLAKIGEPAVPYLIRAIRVREGYKFAWGTVALEKMGRKAKAAIPTLYKIANDPTQKENRRREALETIAKIQKG